MSLLKKIIPVLVVVGFVFFIFPQKILAGSQCTAAGNGTGVCLAACAGGNPTDLGILDCTITNPSGKNPIQNTCCGPAGSVAPTTQNATTTLSTSPWYNQDYFTFSEKVFDTSNNDIFGERYTYAQVTWVINSIMAVFLGPGKDILNAIQLEATNPTQGYEMFNKTPIGQVFGVFNSATLAMYSNMPASGVGWLADGIHRFSIIPTAYAQTTNGIGFDALHFILPLWRAVRNISYLLLTLAAVVLAFMIMFRSKINPQTIITVQSAIPRIVIAVILITFSYAIAGFLIDLMYLLFFVAIYALNTFGGIPAGHNAVYYVGQMTNSAHSWFWWITGTLISGVTRFLPTTSIGGGLIAIAAPIIVGVLASSGQTGTAALGWMAGVGLFLAVVLPIIIALVIYNVQIVIMLASSYLTLLLNVAFAPIIILYQTIFPSQSNKNGWMKSVIADLLVFLITGGLFVINDLFHDLIDQNTISWTPPYVTSGAVALKVMVSLAVVVLLPSVRGMARSILGLKEGPKLEFPREITSSIQRGIETATSSVSRIQPPH